VPSLSMLGKLNPAWYMLLSKVDTADLANDVGQRNRPCAREQRAHAQWRATASSACLPLHSLFRAMSLEGG
jgi:hypothetical protein